MAESSGFAGLRQWLKWSLLGYAAMLAVESLACLLAIVLLSAATPGVGALQIAGTSLILMAGAALVQVALNILIAVLFLRLLYKAVQQARGFSPPFSYVSPGWAVGYWFIPVMNLYRPFQVVKELLKAGAAQSGGKFPEQLLSAWWAMFLISNFAGLYLARMDLDTSAISGIISYCEYTFGGNVLDFAAVALFWPVIKRLVALPQAAFGAATMPATS